MDDASHDAAAQLLAQEVAGAGGSTVGGALCDTAGAEAITAAPSPAGDDSESPSLLGDMSISRVIAVRYEDADGVEFVARGVVRRVDPEGAWVEFEDYEGDERFSHVEEDGED